MSFMESYKTKQRLDRLCRLWDRMRVYTDADPAGPPPGSEQEFLALKRDIGQALNVLHNDFGVAALNREAEQAMVRIRQLLTSLPNLEGVKTHLQKDRTGLQKAWHAIFMILSELSGAELPKKRREKPHAAPRAHAAPFSGDPRYVRQKGQPLRIVGGAVRVVVTAALLCGVVAVALFFAERAGFFGEYDQAGQWRPTEHPVLARIGDFWQGAQNFVRERLPTFYNPVSAYYRQHPEISVIALVGIVGIIIGYLTFIRSR